MDTVTRSLHVLALGLWFGTVVFFTWTGLILSQTFTELSDQPADHRPYWLPLPAVLDRSPPSSAFPQPLRLEQGSRLFGKAVEPIFPRYFALQAGCALVGLLTALTWLSSPRRLEKVRVLLLLAGLLSVGLNWWLGRVVSDLRAQRTEASDAVLLASSPSPEKIQAAEAVRADFGKWHGISLLANFTTLALAVVSLALAGHLPRLPEQVLSGTVSRPGDSSA